MCSVYACVCILLLLLAERRKVRWLHFVCPGLTEWHKRVFGKAILPEHWPFYQDICEHGKLMAWERGGSKGVNEGMIMDKGIIRFNLRFTAVRVAFWKYVKIC